MTALVSSGQVSCVIAQTVTDILGEAASSFFFKLLDRRFSVMDSEIATKPEALSSLLRELFGSGAKAIERCIVNNLSTQFDPQLSTKEFLEAIDQLSNRA